MRRNSRTGKQGRQVDHFDDELLGETRHTSKKPIPLAQSAHGVRKLSVVEDRRNWAPSTFRGDRGQRVGGRDAHGRNARIAHQPKASTRTTKSVRSEKQKSPGRVTDRWVNAVPRFAEAAKTIICLKRNVRKQIMFAFKQTKKGAGARKRRNQWSHITCS